MAKKQKFDYFDAFEQQVEIAQEEADILVEAVETFTSAKDLESLLDRAHEVEHRGDEVNRAIQTNIAIDFITPIERADIIELAQNLDEITDMIESTIQRLYMFDVKAMEEPAVEFARIIKKSTKELRKSMGSFRDFKKVKKIRAMVEDVNVLEEQADALYVDTIRKLYTSDDGDDVRIQVWTRLFERLEGTVDACEAAADTMESIMLKSL